jgi:hypothetical protein
MSARALGIADAKVGWDSVMNGPVDVSLFVKNLTNKVYVTDLQDLINILSFTAGVQRSADLRDRTALPLRPPIESTLSQGRCRVDGMRDPVISLKRGDSGNRAGALRLLRSASRLVHVLRLRGKARAQLALLHHFGGDMSRSLGERLLPHRPHARSGVLPQARRLR